jgi:hypothetical protein
LHEEHAPALRQGPAEVSLGLCAGEVALVGPAISALDSDIGATAGSAARDATEAKRAAQQSASAQEVCSMLGSSLHLGSVFHIHSLQFASHV